MKVMTPLLARVASGERMPDREWVDQNAEQRIQESEKRKKSQDWIPGYK